MFKKYEFYTIDRMYFNLVHSAMTYFLLLLPIVQVRKYISDRLLGGYFGYKIHLEKQKILFPVENPFQCHNCDIF